MTFLDTGFRLHFLALIKATLTKYRLLSQIISDPEQSVPFSSSYPP